MNTKIIPLQPDKTVVLYSPIEIKNTVLVRTSNNKKNLLNAIIISNYKDYWFLKENKKEEFYNDVLSNLSKGDNNYNFVKNIFLDFYKSLTEDKKIKKKYGNILNDFIQDENKKEVFSIIFENITYQDIDHFLNKCYDEEEIIYNFTKIYVNEFMEFVFTKIENNENESLDKEYKNFFLKIFNSLLTKISENYPLNFLDTLNVDNLNTIAEYIEKDIYILDSNNRLPFLSSKIQNRDSIFILYFQDEKHFESLGKLETENKVKRIFKYSDKLVECVYTFLYEAKKIKKKYPTLEKYLSKKDRTENKDNI